MAATSTGTAQYGCVTSHLPLVAQHTCFGGSFSVGRHSVSDRVTFAWAKVGFAEENFSAQGESFASYSHMRGPRNPWTRTLWGSSSSAAVPRRLSSSDWSIFQMKMETEVLTFRLVGERADPPCGSFKSGPILPSISRGIDINQPEGIVMLLQVS